LLYAASRCGDFPEIQEIRAVLTSRFGKEFAARSIELRNNCGVHPQVCIYMTSKSPIFVPAILFCLLGTRIYVKDI